jgi:diguanylate cyclase (GGDEF)-like protein
MSGSFPLSIILIAAAAFTLLMAGRAWRAKAAPPAARPFAAIMLASTFYSVGYAFELASPTVSEALWWSRVQYLGISFIPPFFLFLAARFTGRDARLKRGLRLALIGLGAVTLVLQWTSPLHRLFYVNPRMDLSGAFPTLAFDRGPWYWTHQAYAGAAFFVGMILFARFFLESPKGNRRQSAFVFFGSLVPWIGFITYIFGFNAHHLDLGPFGMALAGPIFAWGIFRLGLVGLLPIAHESVFAGLRDGVIVVDRSDRIIDLNPAAERIFPGLSRKSIGRPFKESAPNHSRLLDLVQPGAAPEMDLQVDFGETQHHYLVRRSAFVGGSGLLMGHSITLSDVTDQALKMDRLRSQATIDDLTGAFNRRHFMELGHRELIRAKRHGRPLSVLIIDLDGLKKTNDTWGHDAGDQVLKAACDALRRGMRGSDLLGRQGGDEFILLLPEIPPAQAAAVAERLRHAMAQEEVKIEGGEILRFTATFGVAGREVIGGDALDDLIRAADRALYEAKAAGRNRVRSAPTGPDSAS